MEVSGRNYTLLASENPFDFDKRITFDEDTHVYTVDDAPVPISVTGVLKKHDPAPFDAPKIILRCWRAWKSNGKKPELAEALADVDTDEAAIVAVQNVWTRSSELGTLLHKRFEALANDADTDSDEFRAVDPDWRQLTDKLLRSKWAPVRSELSVFYTNSANRVVAAGQIDMLAIDADGRYALIDLKRSSKDIGPHQTPFRAGEWTEFYKYSLQLSCYAVMLEKLLGKKIDSENRVLLVADAARAYWVQCTDLDHVALEMLEAL